MRDVIRIAIALVPLTFAIGAVYLCSNDSSYWGWFALLSILTMPTKIRY